jgi:hypothetical protein
MARYYVLGLDGGVVPIDDLLLWAQWFETADRRVAYDVVGPWRVSTVFLSLDHGFGRDEGPPVLWETMVFGSGEGHRRDEWCHRYTSREEALLGHATTVALVRTEVEVSEPIPAVKEPLT